MFFFNIYIYLSRCPHCRPLTVTFGSLRALEYHYKLHGSNLYICQYCDYVHCERSKIESHQARKHPLRMEGENNLNVVEIRKSNYSGLCICYYTVNLYE